MQGSPLGEWSQELVNDLQRIDPRFLDGHRVPEVAMIIGYLAPVFPSLTMTFVYREVRALRARGLDVQTFSAWKPNLADLSDEAKDLVADTFYIFPLAWMPFLLSHVRFLLTRPRRYLGTLLFCLTRERKTFRNRLRTFYHFCQAVYLAGKVERSDIRHLHAHFALNATTIAMVVSRLADATFSFTAHANDLFANPIMLPEKIRSARFIVAISEHNARFLYHLVPTQDTLEKTHVVHCGIDVQQFSPPCQRPSTDRPVILAVGRLVEKKGYTYLIQACRILRDRGYSFRCVIIGDGPQGPILRQLIQENDLSDHVELAGTVFQEHLRGYLAQATLFALPCIIAADGDMDGIPNSLMEAMAMEVPVVSTTVSGIPELIEDGKTGLLVPEKDETALAQAIAVLLENEELRSALARSGRAKVRSEFEIGESAARLSSIFGIYLEAAEGQPAMRRG